MENTHDDEKKKDFENKFSSLVNEHIENYKGSHPIVTWHADKTKPSIEPGFFASLPLKLQEDIELLLAQIAG